MELRKICDDTGDMNAWELAHNMMFVKDREACYRDFERETTLLDLVREIYRKHTGEDGLTQEMDELDDETLDEILADNLQYGTDDWDGVIALLYQTAWGAAELREWLKAYETHGLPTTMRPEVLQQAIDTYGSHAQEEMAIEEMSELTKAIVKRHRAADKPSYDKAMSGIAEEMADVTGIVYEPMAEDSHGNFMTEAEITKAAYWFAKNGNKVDLQHSFEPLDGASVVESWIAKADFDIDGETIKKGTWLMTVEVADESVWEGIEKGEITGLSMGGLGNYSEEDVELENVSKQETSEKKGLLKQLGKMLGLTVVEKGAMAELYEERSKGTLFWNAFNSLEEILYKYDPITGRYRRMEGAGRMAGAVSTRYGTPAARSIGKSISAPSTWTGLSSSWQPRFCMRWRISTIWFMAFKT